MNIKKANWMFLALVVSHAGLNLLAARTSLMNAVVQNMALNIIVVFEIGRASCRERV